MATPQKVLNHWARAQNWLETLHVSMSHPRFHQTEINGNIIIDIAEGYFKIKKERTVFILFKYLLQLMLYVTYASWWRPPQKCIVNLGGGHH